MVVVAKIRTKVTPVLKIIVVQMSFCKMEQDDCSTISAFKRYAF